MFVTHKERMINCVCLCARLRAKIFCSFLYCASNAAIHSGNLNFTHEFLNIITVDRETQMN